MTDATAVDWSELMSSWDSQQQGYLPRREERFRRMFDAIDVLVGGEFLALDLACGPGSISQRLLERFPSARCVAVDVDPVLLAVGQGALGSVDGRLRWAERDLRDHDWSSGLSEEDFDVVLSTTALHWLTPPQLVVVYRQLAAIVRPGGIVLNGDHMPFERSQPSLARLTRVLEARDEERAFEHGGIENWKRWWARLEQVPELAECSSSASAALVATRRWMAMQCCGRPRAEGVAAPVEGSPARGSPRLASSRSARYGRNSTTTSCSLFDKHDILGRVAWAEVVR